MGVPVRLSPTCSSLFSCLPLPWLLPAPSLRRAWRPLRLLPTSTTPLVMLLLTILPLKLRLTSMTSPATLLSPTFTWSPLLPPLLPPPPSPTLPTLIPTAPTPTWPLVPTSLLPLLLRRRLLPPLLLSPTLPTPTMLDTPTPLLPTTPDVSTTLAALCPAHKRLAASKLRPKDRQKIKTNLTFVDLNSNHVNCDQSNRLYTISYCTYRKIQFNIEVISNYSNKNFYSYYAVIPRGTISLCQLRIIFFYSILIKILIFTPKKNYNIILKVLYIPSFIGSFCLINKIRYFHLN